MSTDHSRIVFAGLSGGTGKTIVSLGVCRAWASAGHDVRPFKKGPDYIDATWLGLASGRACSNLDPHFLTPDRIRDQFRHKAAGGDVSVVEGNRGLFDGMDEHGSCSTAELARQLDAPVVLAIDCTKMTRTVAAIVQGCASFEPDLKLAGVICNRTAGERHRSILRKSIETHTDIPVLGMLPKLRANPIPERHMGLVSDQEYDGSDYGSEQRALDEVARIARENLDLDRMLGIARCATPFSGELKPLFPGDEQARQVRIGYVKDAALWFYYGENLEALEHAGAELVQLSILDGKPWPEIDALYLGGGFPETFADKISRNTDILAHIRRLSESGMPIYAECGGFMVLCNTLEYQGEDLPMAGVLPVSTGFCPKPQGLGYTDAEVVLESPFYALGTRLVGHEFHYSRCVTEGAETLPFAVRMLRGTGMAGEKDGMLVRNTFAGYNHIHALAVPEWAPRFVAAAKSFRQRNHLNS